jgi:hypothetical protein
MLLVLGIVGTLVFGSASVAQAAIWPQGFNPKQYMLNVLGSMLSGASPDGKLGGAKRAIIQADQQFDHSWEGLNELWKKDSPRNIPTTHQDYVLQRQQYFNEKGIKGIQGQKATETNTGKGTKYVKPMKAPATKLKKMARVGVGVGVGVGASVGWFYRSELGAAVGGIFGVDTSDAYCSDRDQFGNLQKATDFITGIDCDAWAVDQAFDANAGVTAKPAGWALYPAGYACDSDDMATCYNTFTFNPEVTKVGKNSYTVTAGKKTEDGAVIANYWCKPPTGALKYNYSQFPINTAGNPGGKATFGVDCGTDGQLYALFINGSGVSASQTPETVYTNNPNRHRGFWFSDLSPNYTPGSSDNPDRSFVCTYTLADGKTVEKESTTFKETEDNVPSPVCPAVDPNEGNPVKNVAVDEVNKDTKQKQRVYEDSTTDEYQKWWGAYPECREGACALDLVQKSTQRSCFYDAKSAEACEDWMIDPNKTDHYQCYYGGHKVDLTECYVYGDTLKPEKVLDGTAYSDPATGESTSGQSSPNAAQKTLGRSWTDPQDFRGCLDRGWSKANPVEWVLIPMQCALQWGFAPSQQTIATTNNAIQNSWAGKPPGAIANAVSGWSVSAPTGCAIPVNVMGSHLELANACPGQPLAPVAALSKIATTAVVAVLCFFACRRIVRSWVNDTDSADGGGDR